MALEAFSMIISPLFVSLFQGGSKQLKDQVLIGLNKGISSCPELEHRCLFSSLTSPHPV